MVTRTSIAPRGLTWLVVIVMATTLLWPVAASADTNLVTGGTARIAYANGDDVRLRASAGYDGEVLQMVREGAVVDVIDGPFEDADGNLWYQVTFEDVTGYIVQDFLALESASSDSGSGAADLPFNPMGDAIGAALITGTNGDGVRCRAAADPGAAVVTVVPEGTIVEVTGAQMDVWVPINCGGQGGFVHAQFVSWDLSGESGAADEAASDADRGDAASEDFATLGDGIVTGTNGDGVLCRSGASYSSSIITTLAEGSTVTFRDVVRGDFQGVICAGENGYVAAIYVAYGVEGGESVGADFSTEAITGSAVVSGTNGDGVRCRSGAGTDNSVITVLSEGTEVSLRGNEQGGWQPVVCAGSNGWVASQYLSSGGGGGGDAGGADIVDSGVVTGTGNGLRCRADASFDGSVITVLSDGTVVDIRGSRSGDWLPIVCGGRNGWVFADYIGSGGGGGGTDDGGSGSNDTGFVSGNSVVVSGTSGQGVRLRSSASFNGSVIMVIGEGSVLTVIDGSSGLWAAVATSGTSGFVHSDFLSMSAGGGDDGGDDGGSGGGLAVGDHAMTASNLNLRYDPSFSGGIAAVAPSGTVVEITGNPSSGFYPVNWDGLQGYMHGDYLSWTDEPLSSRGGSGDDGGDNGGGGGGGGGGSATGNAMVDFAMQYLGYPYVWATHGPSSFDCSGFTYWVTLNVLGIDIGAGTFTQIGYGTPVSQSELQPGDIVFFQNTYTWGLSHVGLYIGNGQFIHAENESTGVVISSLSSTYYSSRWYGARRLA